MNNKLVLNRRDAGRASLRFNKLVKFSSPGRQIKNGQFMMDFASIIIPQFYYKLKKSKSVVEMCCKIRPFYTFPISNFKMQCLKWICTQLLKSSQ